MTKKGRGEINKGKSFAVLSHFLHATCFGAHLFEPHLFGNEIQVSPDGKFKKFIITFLSFLLTKKQWQKGGDLIILL
jgi:hypothetical protein